jgi:hypothetical protein
MAVGVVWAVRDFLPLEALFMVVLQNMRGALPNETTPPKGCTDFF